MNSIPDKKRSIECDQGISIGVHIVAVTSVPEGESICLSISYANPLKTVRMRVPRAKNKITRIKVGSFKWKKYPIKAKPGNIVSQAMMQAI